jgi:hypothetical protein
MPRDRIPHSALPPAETGTALRSNTVTDLQHEYQQILEDHVHLLETAGQDYTQAEVTSWAWEVILNRYPELLVFPDNLG